MLPASIITILNTWKSKDLLMSPHLSEYNTSPSQFSAGEFSIIVKREVKITYPRRAEVVSIKKIFRTTTVGTNPPNLMADEYRLNMFLDIVDTEFVKKVFDTESMMSEELNPPGFIL